MAWFETANLRVEKSSEGGAILSLDVADRSVNVFNRQVLADLESALDRLGEDRTLKLLGIRSASATKPIAGADIQTFADIKGPEEASALSALGQRVFEKLAKLSVPTFIVIQGPCLGGGLELALACDYRLAIDDAKTQLGFPEVELGLIPGWGGTQRLPCHVGLERALQMIVGGKRLGAVQAKYWGLVDAVARSGAEQAAELRVLGHRAIRQGKRAAFQLPLRTWRQRLLESNPVGRSLIIRGATRILQNRVPEDMPAPAEALAAVCTGIRQGMDAGFQYEREAIGRLASSMACRNLVGLFLQREQARRIPEEPKQDAFPAIRYVGVVGAGTMGAGIAQLAAIGGFEVVVREVNDTALAAGMERIAVLFRKAVDNRVLSDDVARQKLASIKQTTAWQGFGEVDLVVEAALEDLQLKQELFRDLEQHTRHDTILATNTSSLLVEQIADRLRHRERVAGLHFFNPVHKMPLVEVVRCPATNASTEAALKAWAIALGKTPVAVKDGPGFVVNRVLMPYLLEAVVMAGEGAKPDVIDKSMRRFGMPMGPLELLDQIGLDVAGHIARAMQPLFESRLAEKPGMAHAFELMAQNGWLGQKSGIGFYRYRSKKRTINHAILGVIQRAAGTNAATTMASLPVSVQMREARERLVLLMVNEAAACLGSGMAADADAIDLAMVMGTGWAPHRGGPLHYGAQRGFGDVVQKLTDLDKRVGSRFQPCAKLKQLAEGGKQRLFANE